MNELKTKSISVTSRASVKIKDSFYTFEFGITKEVPDDFDMSKLNEAKAKTWDEANGEVDNQINEIVNFIKANSH